MTDNKVVDLAGARKAKQGEAKPCSRTEPAGRSVQQGKYLASSARTLSISATV